MPEVNERTLMMAIQAVDTVMHSVTEEIDSAQDESEQAHLEALLVAYTDAAEDLKKAYNSVRTPGSKLPPYSKLIAGDE